MLIRLKLWIICDLKWIRCCWSFLSNDQHFLFLSKCSLHCKHWNKCVINMLYRKNILRWYSGGKPMIYKYIRNLCSWNEHKLPSDYDDDLMTDHFWIGWIFSIIKLFRLKVIKAERANKKNEKTNHSKNDGMLLLPPQTQTQTHPSSHTIYISALCGTFFCERKTHMHARSHTHTHFVCGGFISCHLFSSVSAIIHR